MQPLPGSESHQTLPENMPVEFRAGRRTTFTIGMTVAVLATALAWSGMSLKDLIATLFR